MKERTNDEQTKMFLHGNLEVAKDLTENGLEAFVQKESLSQIMSLLLEEQLDNLMFGEISDTNDFEDQIRCVKQEEKARCIQFMKILLILYVFNWNQRLISK